MEALGLVAIVALLVVKESGVPIPVPGDLIVIGAGVAASRGAFDPLIGLVVIVIGGLIGGIVQFVLIRGAARRVLLALLDRVGIGRARLDPAADRLRSRGIGGVALARATPGVRIIAIAASALAALPLPVFAAGLVIGNSVFVSAHYLLGLVAGEAAVPLAASLLGPAAIVLVVLAAGGAMGWWWLARRRRAAGAAGEAALPAIAGWTDAACPACLTIAAIRGNHGNRSRDPLVLRVSSVRPAAEVFRKPLFVEIAPMRSSLKLSGLVLAAATMAACVAGPGAANPSPSAAPATPAPTNTPKPSPSGPPAIEHPTGKDALVLRITIDGGFVPVGYALTTLPVISIYGDGRVITQGAQIMIYPGPALPSLWVKTITEQGLQKVLAAAAEAGLLGPDRHYENNMIADAPDTTFILNAGGRVHTISAYALFEEELTNPNLSAEDAAARKLLRTFLDQVMNLPALAGASELGAEEAYKPACIRLFVTAVDPDQPAPSDQPAQEAVTWPLTTPLATFGTPVGTGSLLEMRCGVVDGADLDTLWPILEKANALTPFTSGGKEYTFLVRPLLPDESGCPTL